jgi:hypothetical protein
MRSDVKTKCAKEDIWKAVEGSKKDREDYIMRINDIT